MYMDRLYRLQLEFFEISQALAQTHNLDDRRQLFQRRLEIIAEASELVYTSEAGIPVHRVPSDASSSSGVSSATSE
jgi:hypothetical protein